MRRKLNVCILDTDKQRCCREEKVLEEAIAIKNLQSKVAGTANYGEGHIQRSGYRGTFPVIDVEGKIFTHARAEEEFTLEVLCDFLDMLIRRKIIEA